MMNKSLFYDSSTSGTESNTIVRTVSIKSDPKGICKSSDSGSDDTDKYI